ncbi:camphor resistance CrcB family protein [Actinidia rufa]|uniref:Camphor resistance CrcB family protein n=1 Tax=Actinidia rufa TaxID=165716 RepID=A0A7J0EI59_9ERIC|nr:camphor resistance CrcB family protein [Actinidia rufa]
MDLETNCSESRQSRSFSRTSSVSSSLRRRSFSFSNAVPPEEDDYLESETVSEAGDIGDRALHSNIYSESDGQRLPFDNVIETGSNVPIPEDALMQSYGFWSRDPAALTTTSPVSPSTLEIISPLSTDAIIHSDQKRKKTELKGRRMEEVIPRLADHLGKEEERVGSFLMGWWGVVFKGDISRVSDYLAIGLTTGYLGSLTTFSGWNQKMLDLSVQGKWVFVVLGFLIGFFLADYSIIFGVKTAQGFKWLLKTLNVLPLSNQSNSISDWKADNFNRQSAVMVVLLLMLGLLWGVSGALEGREFQSGSSGAQLWLACIVGPFGVWIRWFLARLNGRGLGRAGLLKWVPFGTLTANVSAACVMAALATLKKAIFKNGVFTYFQNKFSLCPSSPFPPSPPATPPPESPPATSTSTWPHPTPQTTEPPLPPATPKTCFLKACVYKTCYNIFASYEGALYFLHCFSSQIQHTLACCDPILSSVVSTLPPPSYSTSTLINSSSSSSASLDHYTSAPHTSSQSASNELLLDQLPSVTNSVPPQLSPEPLPSAPTHHMMTRSKHGIVKPKVPFSLVATASSPTIEPHTFFEAIKHAVWKEAMDQEYSALQHQWSLVPCTSNVNLIACQWIYKIKRNSDGSVARYKTRLMPNGNQQAPGLYFTETFNPVIKQPTLRALYGLRQAPRAWYSLLAAFLHFEGFVNSAADVSLFILNKNQNLILLLVYVDDLIITGNNASLLSHDTSDILTKAGMHDRKPSFSPAAMKCSTEDSWNAPPFSNPVLYRSLVRSLQYLTLTRPEIAHALMQSMWNLNICNALLLLILLQHFQTLIEKGILPKEI